MGSVTRLESRSVTNNSDAHSPARGEVEAVEFQPLQADNDERPAPALWIEFARATGDWPADLQTGHVIDFEDASCQVRIMLGDIPVAVGETIIVDDQLAVRITELISEESCCQSR